MNTIDYIALKIPEPTDSASAVVLDCDRFQVQRGEVFGLLGAARSGKSALMRRLAELLAEDKVHITLSGHRVLQDEETVKRLINRVLADYALFQKLTPLENLIYGARLYNLGEREANARALTALEQAGLDEEAIHRPVRELDTQAQRKVAEACAALAQPALLLLDEPTAGLPADERRATQSLIEELQDTYKATVLLATQDAGEADALCDRIAILEEGQIVALDTPEGLKGRTQRADRRKPTLADALAMLTNKELND